MIKSAVEKINAEMQADAANGMLEAVGEYLIDICKTDDIAGKLLAEKKTVRGAVEEMTAVARKKAQNSKYAMRDDEAFAIVRKYYGIADAPDTANVRDPYANVRDAAQTPPEQEIEIKLDFDSFWG